MRKREFSTIRPTIWWPAAGLKVQSINQSNTSEILTLTAGVGQQKRAYSSSRQRQTARGTTKAKKLNELEYETLAYRLSLFQPLRQILE